MFVRKFVLVCAIFVSFAGGVQAQSLADINTIPLIVDEGFPLQVVLTNKLKFKENSFVCAKIVEPVYAFDREVIPAGTRVVGRITGFRKVGKAKRIFAMLGGDFTPLRDPKITFHTLVFPDGRRMAIETSVGAGTDRMVRLETGKQGSLMSKALAPGLVKGFGFDRLKSLLWGMSPYRPQSLPAGTTFTAVLLTTLDFGVAVVRAEELGEIGSQPPPGHVASVRLMTPLDSRTTLSGSPIEAELTRPLFNMDQRLIFPAGSLVHGEVLKVKAAKSRHRNGQLTFQFTTIAPPLALAPAALPRKIEGSLVSVKVGRDTKNLQITKDGGLKISESKARFIAPVWAFIKAERSLNATADPFPEALLGAYRGKLFKQFSTTESGSLGLPASISGAMIPAVGIGLGVYGAARSVYTNFLGRGQDIRFPVNTPMQIRLDEHIEHIDSTDNGTEAQ